MVGLRIVHYAGYFMRRQVLLQRRTLARLIGHLHGVLMENMRAAPIPRRGHNAWDSSQCRIILSCYLLARRSPGGQMAQLHAQ